jgi:hypothetical protein
MGREMASHGSTAPRQGPASGPQADQGSKEPKVPSKPKRRSNIHLMS